MVLSNRKEEMETRDGQSNLEYTVRLAVTSNPIIFQAPDICCKRETIF